jgi:hypothetical protein
MPNRLVVDAFPPCGKRGGLLYSLIVISVSGQWTVQLVDSLLPLAQSFLMQSLIYTTVIYDNVIISRFCMCSHK